MKMLHQLILAGVIAGSLLALTGCADEPTRTTTTTTEETTVQPAATTTVVH
jgi:hypothetical protein